MEKTNRWTDKQVKMLRKFYGEMPVNSLANMLGKTPTAITSKVHYLRARGWTFSRKTDIKTRKVTPPHGMTHQHKDKTKYNRKDAPNS
jgi:hypothetical protein